jgi:hypothetical protein
MFRAMKKRTYSVQVQKTHGVERLLCCLFIFASAAAAGIFFPGERTEAAGAEMRLDDATRKRMSAFVSNFTEGYEIKLELVLCSSDEGLPIFADLGVAYRCAYNYAPA